MISGKLKWLYRLIPVLLLLTLSLVPVLAQDTVTYTAPDESFTTTVPARWTDESTDAYGKFTLEDGTAMYLLRVDAVEVQTGISAALAIIDPELTAQPVQITDLPAPDRIWTQNIYLLDAGAISAAIGTVDGESVYVIYIVSPGTPELTAASPDLNQVLLSLKIAGGLDLTGAVPAAFDRQMSADLDAYVTQALADYRVPGAAVAVVQNGVIVYASGFGVTALDGAPVDADTLFMIGSQTKSMTTLIMATLVDQGVFTWDTPVTDVLPTFALSDPEATAQIKMRDLVNMSSGVPRYDMPLALKNQTAAEVIESLQTIPLVAKPGEKFNYNNQMVAAGGFISALAAGATYDGDSMFSTYTQLLQERVFDPLGMTRSTVDFDTALADLNHALPYGWDYETGEFTPVPVKSERFATPIAPAGAVWSSANEMGAYLIMEMNKGVTQDGTPVVSEANLLETQAPAIAMGDGGDYAMGWMISEYNGLRQLSHGGNTGGFTCEFNYLPDANLGVVVLINRGLANSFGGAVSEYVSELVFGLEHTADTRYRLSEKQFNDVISNLIASIKTVEFNPDTVTDFVGDYEYALHVFINDDGELAFSSDFNDGLLSPINDDTYLAEDSGIQVKFVKAADGSVTATLSNLIDPTQVFTVKKLE